MKQPKESTTKEKSGVWAKHYVALFKGFKQVMSHQGHRTGQDGHWIMAK